MISKEEIQIIASEKKLSTLVIEKDYILGWLIAGINQHSETHNAWVFKGGTCLRKCFFNEYRFSEDLDFSYMASDQNAHIITSDYYNAVFLAISEWVYENSGIMFPEQGIKFETFDNPRGSISVQGSLAYRGPIQPHLNIKNLPRIKIDLTLDEPLILKPNHQEIYHDYSDKPEAGIFMSSYSLEEIFAEKLRALVERLRPRDLYDVVQLFQKMKLQISVNALKDTLNQKCILRSVPIPAMEIIDHHKNRRYLESEWETQLKHQVQTLIPFEEFIEILPELFKWLE